MPFRFLSSPIAVVLRTLAVLATCISLVHTADASSADTRNLSASASIRRVALVIGNDTYKHVPPLEKAANDARAMGRALEQAHFETRVVVNATRAQMNSAINQFADDVAGGGIGIFFFAGHGVQVNNQNFLIPIDLQNIQREADVADQGVSLQGMQDKLAEVRAKFSLLVIDACRDNPLPKKAGRALGGTRGLTQASSAEGQMVVFSAGANQQALDKLADNDLNPNGVFTREFLPWLNKPGVSIRDAVLGVRSAVRARAKTVNHEQFPAIYDQAEGNFYFIDGGTQVASLGAQIVGGRSAAQIEDELWDAIKDGDKASVFEEYLKQYPKGRYLAQARIKIAKLKAEARQPVPAAVSPAPTFVAATTSDPETALWSEVQKGNTTDDYDVYLKQYPKGKYVALAKQRLQKLKDEAKQQAEAAEQSAWQAAESTQTPEGYAAYLASYPRGRYAALAQTRSNKLKADAAVQEESRLWQVADKGGKAEVDTYLSRYPSGRYASAAQLKLAQITARVAEEQRKAREEAARGPQWADSDNGAKIKWDEAKQYCASKGSGWRLPTVAELEKSYLLGQPTACGSHEGTQQTCKVASKSHLSFIVFWSSEPNGSAESWVVFLTNGKRHSAQLENQFNNIRALCVRRP
jgi:outer membrane protein assembly factor BamD (BamD/ComL family)